MNLQHHLLIGNYLFVDIKKFLDGWLTVQRSITLVDFQLDAQNSYLFTYNNIY